MTHNAHLDALLENREWLVAVAQRLLSDGSRAEDAVQDTALSLMQRVPPYVPSPSWLARLVKQRAWSHARSERRRTQRERSAARREPVPSDTTLLGKLETQRRVVEAVQALAPRYRRVVLLRFLEGMSIEQIATDAGITPSGVRTRLRRALSQLRAALDSEFGSHCNAAAALALMCGWPTPSKLAAVGAGGVLIMKKLATIALALLCAVGVYLLSTNGLAPESPDPHTMSHFTLPVKEPADETEPKAQPTQQQDSIPVEVAEAPPLELERSEEPPPPASPAQAIVKGHIWRTDGRSLEGSRVVLYGPGRPGSVIDEEGFFEITTDITEGVPVFLEHGDYLVALDTDVRPLRGSEVVLELEVEVGHEVLVQVRRKDDGSPVVGELLGVRRATHQGQASLIVGRTDDAGEFLCEFLPEAQYLVELNLPRFKSVDLHFAIPATGPIVVELERAPMVTVHLENHDLYELKDRVFVQLYSRSGNAILNGSLSGSPDEEGQFICKSPGPGKWSYDIAGNAEVPRATGEFTLLPEVDEPVIRLVLPPPGDVVIKGELLDGLGEPITEGNIGTGDLVAELGANGEFRLQRVKPGERGFRWKRLRGEGRIERSLGQTLVPDQNLAELTLVVEGKGAVRSWIEGLPDDLAIGKAAYVLDRLEGDDSTHLCLGVVPADTVLTLDYLPDGDYRIRPMISYMRIVNLPAQEFSIAGGSTAEVVFEYRSPAVVTFQIKTPESRSAPSELFLTITREGRYVRSEQVKVKEDLAELRTYLDGTYTFKVEADGFEAAKLDITVVPEEEQTVSLSLGL